MIKIQPTRTDLLNATVRKIHENLEEKILDVKDSKNQCQKQLEDLQRQRNQSRLNLSRFTPMLEALQTVVNPILTQAGFNDVNFQIRVDVEEDDEGNKKACPTLEFETEPSGRLYSIKATKILDEQIAHYQDLLQSLRHQVTTLERTASHWACPNSRNREAVMTSVIENDPVIMKSITMAANTAIELEDVTDQATKLDV